MMDGLKPLSLSVVQLHQRKLKERRNQKWHSSLGMSGEHSYHHGSITSRYNCEYGPRTAADQTTSACGRHLVDSERAAWRQGRPSPDPIFTKLEAIANIFHPDDDELLNYLEDDGSNIEPEFYVPVIPMVLVDGADGIGTG
jgi:DNA topoisomerase-2